MSADKPELTELITTMLVGQATEEQAARLSRLLLESETARDQWLRQADLHASLAVDESLWSHSAPAGAPAHHANSARRVAATPWRLAWLMWPLVAGVAGVLLVWSMRPNVAPPDRAIGREAVARFGELRNCQWVSVTTSVQPGDAIRSGQSLELSSGKAQIQFVSGAGVTLIGPAIFEPLTSNSGFLTIGELRTVANTPQSKGFTLHTRTAKLVDIGTEFVATASADGRCHVEVAVGEVDVSLEGAAAVQHLRAGDSLSIEPGQRQITARIESGAGTAAFRFPSIAPPSDRDYADQSQGRATIRVLRGKLAPPQMPADGGPPEVLLDGRGQPHQDAPSATAFFIDNGSGAFLLDLGQAVSVAKVNTYSWHQNFAFAEERTRAVQRFALYGFAGDKPPVGAESLANAGWVQLARVNTDEFFRVAQPRDRPAQQACSITAARGSLGRFRYLLWEVEPTPGPDPAETNNTFYGEFDVFAEVAE